MKYKEFDLEQARKQNGEGLITRDGRLARIIHWDLKNTERPIVAIITDFSGVEYTQQFRLDGKFYGDGVGKSQCDLFMAPTKHEGWVNVYRTKNGTHFLDDRLYRTEDEAMQCREMEAIPVACKHIEWEE